MLFPLASPRTRRVYESHLRSIARECGQPDAVTAVAWALRQSPNSAALFVSRWLRAVEHAGLSAATMRGRVAAMRAVAPGNIPRFKLPKPARARYSVSLDDVRRLCLAARSMLGAASASRFEAATLCMFVLGLRVGELVALERDALEGELLRVRRKGGEVQRVSVPAVVGQALDRYLATLRVQGRTLFVTASGAAWSSRAVRSQLAAVSARALGRSIPPHALRHAAVTAALDLADGNVRAVAAWAGHADVRTTLRHYDDAQDVGGRVAADLAAALALPAPAEKPPQLGAVLG